MWFCEKVRLPTESRVFLGNRTPQQVGGRHRQAPKTSPMYYTYHVSQLFPLENIVLAFYCNIRYIHVGDSADPSGNWGVCDRESERTPAMIIS